MASRCINCGSVTLLQKKLENFEYGGFRIQVFKKGFYCQECKTWKFLRRERIKILKRKQEFVKSVNSIRESCVISI